MSHLKFMSISFLRWAAAYLFAPVQTILPELKTSAVVLGSLIRMMTAAKRYRGEESCDKPHTLFEDTQLASD